MYDGRSLAGRTQHDHRTIGGAIHDDLGLCFPNQDIYLLNAVMEEWNSLLNLDNFDNFDISWFDARDSILRPHQPTNSQPA